MRPIWRGETARANETEPEVTERSRAEVEEVLAQRTRQSGLDEKASRKRD